MHSFGNECMPLCAKNVYGSAMYSTDIQADFLNMARREGESDLVTNFHNWTLFTSSMVLQLLYGKVISVLYKI